MRQTLAPIAIQMAGMTLVDWGLEDWLPRRPLDITAGHLVNVLIMFLGTVLVLRFVDPLMRGAIHTPMRTSAALILVFMANTAACVAALMFLDEVIWRVPAGWALTIGTAVLAAGWGGHSRGALRATSSPRPSTNPTHRTAVTSLADCRICWCPLSAP